MSRPICYQTGRGWLDDSIQTKLLDYEEAGSTTINKGS